VSDIQFEKGEVELRCQKGPGSHDMHRLVVPLAHLNRHLHELYERVGRGTVSLFLSAEDSSHFVDQRGTGKLPLGQFLQP
jgi:hypothetical protein